MAVDELSIRSALAEHLGAYAEVTTSTSRQWASQLARRIVIYVIAASLALLTLVVGIFVAILASWNTPYRWWVAGGILVVCFLGIVAALVSAALALRTRVAPPWAILAEQLATDLSGQPGEPVAGDDAALQRLQDSREQLQGVFSRPTGSGAGARLGLGLAGLLMLTLIKRRTRKMGGMGVALSLALAGLRMWRKKN
jgi:hypothetical protein